MNESDPDESPDPVPMPADPVIQPNKTEEERIQALLRGDVETEDLPESQKTKKPVVVGIGASAGGLEALSTFFDNIPPDTGLTFVVVTHLSPDHKSILGELLQRHTPMPVIQVMTEKVAIHPNHVYVIPPNRQLVLSDSDLHTAAFDKPRAERAPIDIFFRSLAAFHAEPIGIVLTGGGSDGALGIRSVKEAGGLVLVQDPLDAAYDSMPRSAISTGVVDVILPLRELAAKLVEISRRHTRLPIDPSRLSPEQADALQRILAQLHTRTGHDFRAYKQSTILRRIQRRMQLTGFETLEGYLPFIRQNADEAQALLGDLLIGVTNFFRDEESWRQIETEVIPHLFAGRERDEALRVWSVGCSTGEEAFTLAMLLMEHAATLDHPPPFQVFATDLDEASLAKAREGFYPDVIAADVTPERLQRFFAKEGSYYRVRREVRDNILFASHSVLRDPPFSRIDLIACRNLLIYFQRPLQDNLFEIFHYALRPGGYLYLGNSESADAAGDLFLTVDKKHRIYQAREWNGTYPNLPSLPLVTRNPRRNHMPRPRERNFQLPEPSINQTSYEQTLEEFGPPTVLIDDEANIVRLSGTAGRYLSYPDGPPTSNLTHLVRAELQVELRAALFHSFERGVASVSGPIMLNLDAREQRVYISVSPRIVPGDRRLALVVFIEDATVSLGSEDQTQETEIGSERRAYQQLEGEVKHLRERLQATIEEYETSNEELKAANEELQSINEEYRSTTEELETSKEELQSVNEELETVNNELKSKLEEISRAHSDLQNLLSATETAILFLDRDLRIQRHTVGVEQIFNILRTDRGRPIEHLTHQLDYPTLTEDAHNVLRTLSPLERSVTRSDGQAWYLARLRPYRTLDDRIDGVVISFVDVTAIKSAEADLQQMAVTLEARVQKRTAELETTNSELAAARDRFETLFQISPVPSIIIDMEELIYVHANQAYLDFHGLTAAQVVGKSLFDGAQWPDEAARQRAAAEFRARGPLRASEYVVGLAQDEQRTILASDAALELDGRVCTLVTFLDITERKRAEEEVRRLASELTLAEHAERQRISGILHGDLQQRLYALQVLAVAAQTSAAQGRAGDGTLVELAAIADGLRQASEMTRRLSVDMAPPILRDEGLFHALLWLGSEMRQQFGLTVDVRLETEWYRMEEGLRIALFQVVRELLFNVVKHAEVERATVSLSQIDHHIHIEVRDDGVGFDAAAIGGGATSHTNHGLSMARRRITLYGGQLNVTAEPGQGTTVIITVPIDGRHAPKNAGKGGSLDGQGSAGG